MKIKTNIRAGRQTRSANDSPADTTVVYVPPPVYVAPVSRCTGV